MNMESIHPPKCYLKVCMLDFQVDIARKNSSFLCIACMLLASTSVHKPDVIVFSGFGTVTSEQSSSKKMQRKYFIVRLFSSPTSAFSTASTSLKALKSSKVSKLRDNLKGQDQTTMGTSDSVDNE